MQSRSRCRPHSGVACMEGWLRLLVAAQAVIAIAFGALLYLVAIAGCSSAWAVPPTLRVRRIGTCSRHRARVLRDFVARRSRCHAVLGSRQITFGGAVCSASSVFSEDVDFGELAPGVWCSSSREPSRWFPAGAARRLYGDEGLLRTRSRLRARAPGDYPAEPALALRAPGRLASGQMAPVETAATHERQLRAALFSSLTRPVCSICMAVPPDRHPVDDVLRWAPARVPAAPPRPPEAGPPPPRARYESSS